MNPLPIPPSPEDRRDNLSGQSACPDILDVVSDGPGDNTIRPCRPERRAALEAEREMLRRWWRPEGVLDEQGNIHPHDSDVDANGQGDNTIRPCRPERRALLEADREKPAAEDAGNDQGAA